MDKTDALESLPQCLFVHQKSYRDRLGMNSRLRDKKPATYSLRPDTP